MKVSLDGSRCQGHGRCHLVSPDIFDLDEEGFGVVLAPEVTEERRAEVRDAVANCPERAVSATD